MFNFKKDKEVKETVCPKFTPLYIRISSLYHAIDNNKCYIYSSSKTNSFAVTEIYNNNKDLSFTFNSNNGPIKFKIESLGNEEYKEYRLRYINTSTKWMFEINVGTEYTGVQPNLGGNILALDIDLALLEVETFIDDIVRETKTNITVHLKELKKLENLDFSEED